MNLLCPHCHKAVAVPDQAVGMAVACPLCANAFMAPPVPASAAANRSSAAAPSSEPASPAPATTPEPAARRLILSLSPAVLGRVLLAGFCLLLLSLFLPWERVVLPSTAAREGRPAVLRDLAVILDCGASMNERLPDGAVKIETLRKAVGDLLDRLPDGLRVAFLLYGRDREEPCKVEVIRKLRPLDGAARAEIKDALASAAPSGQAALAEALRLTAEELNGDSPGGGVLVLTDGPDTCGGDARARAAALAEHQAAGYGVHIVALGATPKDLRALRETTMAGKGRLHDAQNAAELSEGLEQLLGDARQSTEREALLAAAPGGRLRGLRLALGFGPVASAPLLLLYGLVTLLGLLAAAWLAVFGRTSGRLSAWLPTALALGAVVGLLLLLLQLALGFPVEREPRDGLVAYRTLWVVVVVLAQVAAVLATLLLAGLRRRAHGRPVPRVEITW
jgi:hypothetical protein